MCIITFNISKQRLSFFPPQDWIEPKFRKECSMHNFKFIQFQRYTETWHELTQFPSVIRSLVLQISWGQIALFC